MRAESLQWRAPASFQPLVAARTITGVPEKFFVRPIVMTHARQFYARMTHVLPAAAVLDVGRFVASASSARSPTSATVAGFSIATTSGPLAGSPRCNNAPSDIGAETSSRIPSTNTPGSVAAVPPVFSVACSLGVDFYDELTDLDWGSWEGSLPESSSLGGDGRPLRGASFMDATSSIRDSRTHCGKNSINFAGTATPHRHRLAAAWPILVRQSGPVFRRHRQLGSRTSDMRSTKTAAPNAGPSASIR